MIKQNFNSLGIRTKQLCKVLEKWRDFNGGDGFWLDIMFGWEEGRGGGHLLLG